jgi:hypothetical protein
MGDRAGEQGAWAGEKNVQIKLDLIKEKAGKLIVEMEGGEGKPVAPLTREELLEKVREIYGAV